jgi:hypothetical protein
LEHDVLTYNLMVMQATEDGYEKAKAILGEFFPNFAIVVQYEDGSVWHEANNALIEKALYIEALDMLKEEKRAEDTEVDIDWEEEEDEPPPWSPEEDD